MNGTNDVTMTIMKLQKLTAISVNKIELAKAE
jgi:hypothetical protein